MSQSTVVGRSEFEPIQIACPTRNKSIDVMLKTVCHILTDDNAQLLQHIHQLSMSSDPFCKE